MYTNGEWKLTKESKRFVVVANGFYDVAIINDIGDEDNEANAKLIAAAPALLEALELAREEIKILLLDAGVVFPDQQETICRIDAAIAAAKGE